MKFSIIIVGGMAAFLLSACGGGGGDDSCQPPDALLCGIFADPAAPATVTVNAGPDKIMTEGDNIGLGGSATHSQGSHLDYMWTQSGGPSVEIVWAESQIAGFVAPPVDTSTQLTFHLRATAWDGLTNADIVVITVEPTSASALCLQAPLFVVSYAWTNSGCTTDSADIAGDSRVATVYRQGEAEPNDSMQLANPLTFPMPVGTERTATDVAGFVSGEGNDLDDLFVFTPPETGIFEVYLCNDPLVCIRGTVTDDWFLSVSNQNFEVVSSTDAGSNREQVVSIGLEAGLPYYIGVHVWDANSASWNYNLTILSESN